MPTLKRGRVHACGKVRHFLHVQIKNYYDLTYKYTRADRSMVVCVCTCGLGVDSGNQRDLNGPRDVETP